MFGYNNCNGLLMAGPYDLVSNNANTSFDTANGEAYFQPQILPPIEMKNNTRWSHNEFSNERLIYDKATNTLKKRVPDYIIWIDEIDYKNENENRRHREYSDSWRMTKKAAAQLGIPIIIINRERCIKENYEEIKAITNQFLSEKNKSEFIRIIIKKFENNAITMINAEQKLKNEYFTKEDRISLLKIIDEELQKIKETDPEEYRKCISCLAETLYSEFEYSCGQGGERLNEYVKILEKYYDDIEQQNIEGYTSIVINLSLEKRKKIREALECVDELGVYEANKSHSIYHISKVVILAEILAQNEGTTEEEMKIIRAAAAFHDCARNGKDGHTAHARKSAEYAGKFFNENQENVFDISKDLIGVVQVAIEYHEYMEKRAGVTEERIIKCLAQKYGVTDYEFASLKRICEIIKDADALDRTRFANQGTLDPRYLKTKTAKSGKMIMYAISLNQAIAKKILKESYGLSDEKINPNTDDIPSFLEKKHEKKEVKKAVPSIFEKMYGNAIASIMFGRTTSKPTQKKEYKSDPILILKEKRIEMEKGLGRFLEDKIIEKEIDLSEQLQLFNFDEQNEQHEIIESKMKEQLFEMYQEQKIRLSDIKSMTSQIKKKEEGEKYGGK